MVRREDVRLRSTPTDAAGMPVLRIERVCSSDPRIDRRRIEESEASGARENPRLAWNAKPGSAPVLEPPLAPGFLQVAGVFFVIERARGGCPSVAAKGPPGAIQIHEWAPDEP